MISGRLGWEDRLRWGVGQQWACHGGGATGEEREGRRSSRRGNEPRRNTGHPDHQDRRSIHTSSHSFPHQNCTGEGLKSLNRTSSNGSNPESDWNSRRKGCRAYWIRSSWGPKKKKKSPHSDQFARIWRVFDFMTHCCTVGWHFNGGLLTSNPNQATAKCSLCQKAWDEFEAAILPERVSEISENFPKIEFWAVLP